jgi:branched-subunit amino acid transport protein
MNDLYVWTVIGGLALMTYINRFSFLGILAGRDVPPAVRRALAYVPSAVLPAIIAPMVLVDRASGGLTAPAVWLASVAALAIGVASRNIVLTILGGMAALHLSRLAGL